MLGRNGQTVFLLIAAVCTLTAFSFTSSAFAQLASATSDAAPIDDGWRRTANGWEQIAAWQVPATSSPVPARRLDFHPGAMALLQALVIAAAFRFFSGKTQAARNASPDAT